MWPAGGAAEHRRPGPASLSRPPRQGPRRSPIVQLPPSCRRHPRAALTGNGVKERQLPIGRDHQQASPAWPRPRHLGQELRPGHTDGDGKADLGPEDRAPKLSSDLCRGSGDAPQAPHVKECLVDGKGLDESAWCDGRPRTPSLAGVGIGRHAGRHHDGTGAQAAGLPPSHRRPDAERLGLVAGGEDHSGPHDHGPPLQARVIPLLDRRVERVQIGMQDRRLATHAPMVAPILAGVERTFANGRPA